MGAATVSENLIVYINGTRRLEFDRRSGLPGQVRQLLEEMDADMDAGVELPQGRVAAPTAEQKVHFVIEQLLNVLARNDDPNAASLLCSYVGTRMPDLVAIRVRDLGREFSVDLQFD